MLRDNFTQGLPLDVVNSDIDGLFFIKRTRAIAEDIVWSALRDGYDLAGAIDLVEEWDLVAAWRAEMKLD